jgi:hypothetical protein
LIERPDRHRVWRLPSPPQGKIYWSVASLSGLVVRKRLNLKLSSEKVNGNRIYKIKSSDGGKPSARAAQRQPA